MTVETTLAHGLKKSVFGTQWKEEHDANLELLDPDRVTSGPLAARPAAGTARRFYFATDSQRLYYDNGTSWVEATAEVLSHASSHASGGSDAVTVAESQVTGLVADLAGKASTSHNHGGTYEPVDATILRQANLAGSGSAVTPAKSDHNHDTGYEAKNANIQSHIASGSNPHGVTAAQVGLGNAENKAFAAGVADASHAAASKSTPVDADELPLADSAASNILKKLAWSDLKATLKTYLDTLYVALTGNQTIAGIKTFTSGAVITGVTDGSTAAAGEIGEVLQVNVTGVSISPTSAQMASISLTAGDWSIIAVGEYAGLSSETALQICLNTISASTSGQVRGLGIVDAAVVTGSGTCMLHRRISISATTTYYLNAVTNVTSGNYFYGSIIASRVR